MINNDKIGLVLSGGGYRGLAHVGVLKAMKERNIEADFVSGTSAGAIVGALYASGASWEDILRFFKEADVISYRHYTFQKAGILDSIKYVNWLTEFFPENSFEALKIPLFVATTDLLEARTKYHFTGELVKPLIASCAVPGMFSPIEFEGRFLCDGGVTNNLPVEPLITLADQIIGVYVNPLQRISQKELKSTRSVLQRAYLIMRKSMSQKDMDNFDVFIAPEKLSQFAILSKNRLDEIFELGYEQACIQLDEWLDKIK